MILELRAQALYYDTDRGLVYQVEHAKGESLACVSLFGPGHPEHRQAMEPQSRAGNWEAQHYEVTEHNEPFYMFVGTPARRLTAWLAKQVAHSATSRDGSPEGILDGYVTTYLDGGSAPRQADDDPPVTLDRGW